MITRFVQSFVSHTINVIPVCGATILHFAVAIQCSCTARFGIFTLVSFRAGEAHNLGYYPTITCLSLPKWLYSDGKQNPRVAVTIFITNANNITIQNWWTPLWRLIKMLLHRWVSGLALTNGTRQHEYCHFILVFCGNKYIKLYFTFN